MKNWEEQIELPSKEPDIEYAFILKSETTPRECDKDTLFRVIENESKLQYVTTPQHDTFIIAGTDYETLQPILKKRKELIKSNLNWAIVYTVLFGGIMLLTWLFSNNNDTHTSFEKLNLLIFGIIPTLSGLYDRYIIKKINESNYHKEASELRFNFWMHQERVLPIYIFTGILVLITALQFSIGLSDSIDAAGLVKPRTLIGEYWRLLTCTLLHGSVIHIIFNGIAVYIIGRMVIRITGFWYFAIVFLVSGILGSLFSLYFMPNVTSVGASGGIMGLIGFILVLSIKFSGNIPRNIIKSMLITIILVAVTGLSAPEIIDNAAHGGGLLGGILIGLFLIRKRKSMIPYQSNILIKVLGILATLILICGVGIVLNQFYM